MEIKLKVTINTKQAVEDASALAERLNTKNLRRTKVEQKRTEPKEGELSPVEWSNVITLLVSSGFALGAVKTLFDLLKGVFVEIPKAKIEADTKKYEVDSAEKVELAKLDQAANYVELNVECGDRKYNFRLTNDSHEKEQDILDTIKELEENCK